MFKLALTLAIILLANGCEKGFFSFKGRQCVKLFDAKATYKMAEVVCNNYGNSTIASFQDKEEMEFYRLIAYSVMNVKNNVWIDEKQAELNKTNCPCLSESDETLHFVDCEEKHSFLCKQQISESLEDKFTKLKQAIEKQIIDLSTKIDRVNDTVYSTVSNTLSVSQIAENSTDNFRLTTNVLQRFFYMSEKIDKCAVPPSIKLKPESRNLNFSEGETIELECEPQGFPTPSIRWNDPINNHLSNYSTLKIENVNRFQSGLYTCIAENEVGKPNIEKYNIQVHHAPKVTVKENKIFTGTGLTETMICYILSNPKPDVRWVKVDNGVESNEISNTLGKSTFFRSINDTYFESKLEITINSHSNLGIYQCCVNNGIGEASSKIELKGSAPFNSAIISVDQTDLKTFDVRTSFTSYSSILNYKLLLRQIPSKFVWELPLTPNETVFTISNNVYKDLFKLENLNVNSEYGVKVMASNEFGWGNASDEYKFHTTYICGENGKSVNEWRYMISHFSYGVQDFDKYYQCSSKLTAETDVLIEIEFTKFSVSQKNEINYGGYRTYRDREERVTITDNVGKETKITSVKKLNAQKQFSLKLDTSSRDEKSSGFILRFRNNPFAFFG